MIPKNGGRSLGERHKRNGETEVAGNNEGLLPNGFRGGKSRILGEFTALDDHLRKHGIRLLVLSQPPNDNYPNRLAEGRSKAIGPTLRFQTLPIPRLTEY